MCLIKEGEEGMKIKQQKARKIGSVKRTIKRTSKEEKVKEKRTRLKKQTLLREKLQSTSYVQLYSQLCR